jgi:ABC-type nitrate/sulfonate/bicarbonate transport system permease component
MAGRSTAGRLIASTVPVPPPTSVGTSKRSWIRRFNPLSVGVVLLAFVVWVVLSNFVLVDSLALPSPQVIGKTFVELFTNGYGRRSIWEHIGTSMGRALTVSRWR